MDNLFLAGNIKFEFSFELSGEEELFYQAELREVNGEFRIYILFDNDNTFEDINYRCKGWNDEIPYFDFGKYIKVENAHIEQDKIALNFKETRLVTMKSEVSNKQTVFYFIINSYQYSYSTLDKDNRAIFYLTSSSKELSLGLNLVQCDFDNPECVSTPYKLYLGGLSCQLAANLESSKHPVVVQFDGFSTIESMIDKSNQFLDVVSFYYATPIEVYLSIIQNAGTTYVKYYQPRYSLYGYFNKSIDLDYLDLKEKHKIAEFLNTINWTDTKKIKSLHVIIQDYIRAGVLDENSKFLVLYSILETYAGRRNNDKFDDYKNMEIVFDELYDIFNAKIRLTEEEKIEEPVESQKPNGKKQNLLKKRWNILKQNLIKKPMKNSVTQFFEKYNIDSKKINEEIEAAKIKDVNTITRLRDTMLHDRNMDYTHILPMITINSKISFAVCIITLQKLGIEKISFHKNYPLLSIFKEE